MKKILNKLKLKHFARVALVIILTCYLLMFLCSASLTVNIHSDGESDDGYSVSLIYNEQHGVNTVTDFACGDELTFSYYNSDINHSDYICDSGTLTPLVDGLSELTGVDLPDGYYNVLLVCVSSVETLDGFDNYAFLSDLGSPLITVTDDLLSEHVSYYYYSDIVPDDLYVNFSREVQGEGDYTSDTTVISALIVPASLPPSPQESITNVWSGVLTFLTTSISTVTNVFWDGSSLTLLGMLGLIGVSIAIITLVFLRVKDFIKLR